MILRHHIGCLLIQGFTSSPTEMAELAANLSRAGSRTSLPTLPGHGSSPQALLRVSHQDWIAATEAARHHVKATTERQVVIGLSMGCVLALHLAARHKFAGVVALASALKLPWWREAGIRLLAHFVQTRRKSRGPEVKDAAGRARWEGYREYPLAATREVFQLQRQVRAELADITMPVLVAHSRQDRVIPVNNVDYLCARIRSRMVDALIVNDSYHVLTLDRDREQIFARVAAFIERVT